ncbi:MAG: permease prefix domain 1-containing protein [Planctomycetota bacterium]
MSENDAITDDATPDSPTPGGSSKRGLRRDIADELADHLELSARAKQVGGADESDAQAQALDAFGNPSQVAHQLYLDAMKGKMMRQKIQTHAVVLVALSAMVLGVVSLVAVRAWQHGMVNAMAVNNEALRHAITAMGNNTATDTPPALDWASLEVELFDENGSMLGDGAGYQIELTGHLFSDAEKAEIDHRVTSGHQARFGPVRTGRHNVSIYTPGYKMQTNHAFTLWPGEVTRQIRITCPNGAMRTRLSTLELNWPEDFVNKSIYAMLEISDDTQVHLGEYHWYYLDQEIVCDTAGKAVTFNSTRFSSAGFMGERRHEDRHSVLQLGLYQADLSEAQAVVMGPSPDIERLVFLKHLRNNTYVALQAIVVTHRLEQSIRYDKEQGVIEIEVGDPIWEQIRNRLQEIEDLSDFQTKF